MKLPACKPIPLNWAMFADNRRRLADAFYRPANEFALLKGSSEVARHTSDTCYSYRQESYFFHQFGLEMPDCLGAVDLSTGKGIIFIPRLPEDFAVWMGKLPTPDMIKDKTLVEEVFYADELERVLKEKGASTVHVLKGKNTDSGSEMPTASLSGDFKVESSKLFTTLTKLRLHKTQFEQAFMHELNKVASQGHVALMQHAKPGRYENELEALFTGYMMAAAQCRCLAYGAIAATGEGGAILHYIENDRQMQDGDMALLDLGGELHCFASDITCSFPVNGKYTDFQKAIYNAVLTAHDLVISHLKPGVNWIDMHKLALRTIGRVLRDDLGLINGSDDELEAAEVMANFMPHGLGHLIGLDVHDVGGYMEDTPSRPTTALAKKCRTARNMEEGICMTVEPGCYFNSVLLEKALADPDKKKFYNEEKIREPQVWNFGGVRIESNVVITETGAKNFSDVPRKVEDVEAVMAGAPWPRSS